MRRLLMASAATMVLVSCGGGAAPQKPPDVGPEATATPASPNDPYGHFRPEWPRTDFARHAVDLSTVIRGCPGRDCIPALDAEGAVSTAGVRTGHARFAPLTDVHYASNLPVAFVSVGSETKGYPLHILTWHEVVNDVVGGKPVVVTFCPLCHTALAFERTLDGRVLDFGVSGMLRNSDLIMWDRQTESWWQQQTGQGIAGALSGSELRPVAASVVSFADFATAYPDASVLTEDTGFDRDYGSNPYESYDAPGTRPFLFGGTIDKRLDGLERVVAMASGSASLAVPFSSLSEQHVANTKVGSAPIVVLWKAGTVSALDQTEIGSSRDVGSAAAYSALLRGQRLTFTPRPDGTFLDSETGSTWDITGHAQAGPFRGARLEPIVHTVQFWFAWAAFHPETTVWRP